MSYSVIELKAGENVFRQGERGRLMYLVQEGEVEVLQITGAEKHEAQVAVLKRKDFFGEMSLLEDEPRTHTVRALTNAKLVQIDGKGLQSMLERKPDIAVRMVRKLSGRLGMTQDLLMRAYASAQKLDSGRTTSPVAVSGSARLIAVQANQPIPLPEKGEIHVGRLDPVNQIFPDVDLTNYDPQISTSRRHAVILRQGDAFFVQEEKATNGTYINGQRLSSSKPLELRSGDEILFGGVRMRFAVE